MSLALKPMACATLLLAASAQATELRFTDYELLGGKAGYGDNVSVFNSSYGAAGGATPNVVLDFLHLTAATPHTVFSSGYGSLQHALGHGMYGVRSEVRFTADPGFDIVLTGFDLAGWRSSTYPNSRIWVTNSANEVLFDTGVFTWAGGATTHYLPAPVRATGSLTLHINDLGDLGLDNVVFSQVSTVPEPAGWVLALGGLAAIGAWHRRRQPRPMDL